MQLPYKKVLIIGGTSGIGWALASRFVSTGTSVIVVGRRKDKLDQFATEHAKSSSATVDTATLDVTDLKAIPAFAADITAEHRDLDCVFLNSGLQRAVDWTNSESVDLDSIETEMLTNYTSLLHLTKAFLPFLRQQAPREMSIIYTTSGLALIPLITVPNYCASKAALHHMILAMREQLRETNVRIVELYPPAVQTELHDFEHGEKGKEIGMPLDEFTEEAFEGLCKEGRDGEQVPVQAVKTFMGFNGWEQERQKTMFKMMEQMKGH